MPWYKRIWVQHPRAVGQTYWQHLYFAMKMGIVLMMLGMVALIHSIFPFVFHHTVSNRLYRMTNDMKIRDKQKLHDDEWF